VKIDLQAIICGKNGQGKSSLSRELVAQHCREGRRVFVQDTNREFQSMLPWFPTVAHYAAANRHLSADGEPRMYGSAAIGDSDHEAITDLVLALSKQYERILPEEKRPQTVVVYDEVTRLKNVLPGYIPPKMEELLANRRHYQVGLMLSCQRTGQLHQGWFDLATDFYVFRTSSRKRVRVMEERFGFDAGVLQCAFEDMAFKFEYLHVHDEEFI